MTDSFDRILRQPPRIVPHGDLPATPGLPHVAPGDLITSETLNRMIDAINQLDARLAAIEGSR